VAGAVVAGGGAGVVAAGGGAGAGVGVVPNIPKYQPPRIRITSTTMMPIQVFVFTAVSFRCSFDRRPGSPASHANAQAGGSLHRKRGNLPNN
jgi:hypothetical protein